MKEVSEVKEKEPRRGQKERAENPLKEEKTGHKEK